MSPRPAAPAAGTRVRPERLRRLAFFRDFTLDVVRRVLSAGNVQRYAKNELLATEGTRKQRRTLYLVLRGHLQYIKRIRARKAQVVLRIEPGEVGGFLTFLNEEPSPVTVRSDGTTVVLELTRRDLQALAAEPSVVGTKLLFALLEGPAKRLDGLLGRVAATAAWSLDLERHVASLPLTAERAEIP